MKIVRRLKPLIWLLELVIIVSLIGSIITLVKKKDVVGERAAELAHLQREHQQLQQRLTEVQSAGFVEREARNKLGLVKPGEEVVLMGTAAGVQTNQTAIAPALPHWKEWWQLFF